MIGFGLQPMGASIVGLGGIVPAAVVAPPSFGARYLGSTGELELDPVTQDIRRMRTNAHRVMMAIRTLIGTAGADLSLGIKWPPDITGPDDPRPRDAVEESVVFLVAPREIELIDVQWGLGDKQGQVWVEVAFRDLTSGQLETVRTTR